MALIESPSLSSEASSNIQVHRLLGFQVASEMLGPVEDAALVKIGPLSCNYFSFTFNVKAEPSSCLRDVFVKIPKVDMRGVAPTILPISEGDWQMAQEEVASLRLLGQKWAGDDLGVYWVKLRGTVPQYNAIVTDRIVADDAFLTFRRLDIRRRFGCRQDAKRLQQLMSRLGMALGRFHQTSARPIGFRLREELPKFEFYCRELAASTRSVWPERVLRKLQALDDVEFAGIEVPTLKGLDIRNVLIDEDDNLYLLDPGKTKFTHREADLARFIMTYRILYWGSKLLLLVRKPDPEGEAAFLKAYYSIAQLPCPQLLGLFLLKEQLKHWHTALNSLQQLPWPLIIKRLVAWIYVNPFYRRQVAVQLQSLTK